MGFRWNWRAWTPVILMGLAWIFLVAATSTHSWCKQYVANPQTSLDARMDVEVGLWQWCDRPFNHRTGVSGSWSCGTFSSDPNSCHLNPVPIELANSQETCRMFMSARAFMVLACIAASFTIALLVAPLMTPTLPGWVNNAGIFLICCTFVFSIIGFATGTHWAIYGTMARLGLPDETCTVGAGVALAFLGWFLTLSAMGMDIYYKKRFHKLHSQYAQVE